MLIQCHARCGNYKLIRSTCSIGEITDKTGYHATFSIGDIVFYCPECYSKAREIAYGLLMVLKDKHVRLEDFFPKSSKQFFPIETTAVVLNERPTRCIQSITLDV